MISRSFNNITFVEDKVIKTSTEKEKLISEYKHYYLMSEKMQRHLVKPYDLCTEGNQVSYSMKRHSDENTGSMYAKGELSHLEFTKIISAVDDFRKNARKILMGRKEAEPIRNQLTVEKSRSRSLELYSATYQKFDTIISSSLLSRLEKAVKEIGDAHSITLVESHGDLCLSNILACYDGNVRFLDPRGADSIWLDEYYDMAKLSQSILGGYDFIINDIPEAHNSQIQDMFLGYLKNQGLSYNLVRVYEASLFISMCPLHMGRHDHIDSFLLKADGILKELGY